MRPLRYRLDDALVCAGTILFLLRHPSCARCPECKLTSEPRSMMARQGGVCHDCFDPFDEDNPPWRSFVPSAEPVD